MTREKQIERQGTLYSDIPANYVEWCDGFQDYDDTVYVEKAFIEGAKWADENPKEGLVSIDKVCEWIEENIWDFPWYDPDKSLSTNDIIKELRKYLEE